METKKDTIHTKSRDRGSPCGSTSCFSGYGGFETCEIIEGDCLTIIRAIQSGDLRFSVVGSLLDDTIRYSCSSFDSISFSFIQELVIL